MTRASGGGSSPGRATYALLIYRTDHDAMPPESEERALVGHRALQAQASQRGRLRAVARLDATTTAKTVRATPGAHDLSDGPYIDTKEWLVGFYLVDCQSEAEALEHAKMIAVGEDHAIEVRPASWVWREP